MPTELMMRAIDYITTNDNCSKDCALCNMTRAALLVVAEKKTFKEAVCTVFYGGKKNPERPKWMERAMAEHMNDIGASI